MNTLKGFSLVEVVIIVMLLLMSFSVGYTVINGITNNAVEAPTPTPASIPALPATTTPSTQPTAPPTPTPIIVSTATTLDLPSSYPPGYTDLEWTTTNEDDNLASAIYCSEHNIHDAYCIDPWYDLNGTAQTVTVRIENDLDHYNLVDDFYQYYESILAPIGWRYEANTPTIRLSFGEGIGGLSHQYNWVGIVDTQLRTFSVYLSSESIADSPAEFPSEATIVLFTSDIVPLTKLIREN